MNNKEKSTLTNWKVNFVFEKDKDLWNIWDAANKTEIYGQNFSKSIPENLMALCKGKKFEEVRVEMETKINYDYEEIRNFIEYSQKNWRIIEKEFLDRVEKITGKNVFPGKVTCYITTIPKCSYNPNEKWFMLCLFNKKRLLTSIAHELFHLQFHQYFFNRFEKEIGKLKAHDIKEALSVLLNIEFLDLIGEKDEGYQKHLELRKLIEKIWKEKKDFKILIEEIIKQG